ncbi:MAG: hypothetical protein VW008_01575, partial [Aquiluna sp.]
PQQAVDAENSDDAIADALARSFQPAQPAPAPEMQWSDEDLAKTLEEDPQMPLDDEQQMAWSEEPTETPRARATGDSDLPEFLTSEIPIVQQPGEKLSRKERKEQKKLEKAQRKAAKNSRYSKD